MSIWSFYLWGLCTASSTIRLALPLLSILTVSNFTPICLVLIDAGLSGKTFDAQIAHPYGSEPFSAATVYFLASQRRSSQCILNTSSSYIYLSGTICFLVEGREMEIAEAWPLRRLLLDTITAVPPCRLMLRMFRSLDSAVRSQAPGSPAF